MKIIFALLAILVLIAPVAVAQDPSQEVEVTEPEDLNLMLLVGIAAAVAMLMEAVKKSVIRPLVLDALKGSAEIYSLVVTIVAIVASAVLVFGSPPEVNILSMTGIYDNASAVVGKILTTLAISFGNVWLHVIYDYLRTVGSRG